MIGIALTLLLLSICKILMVFAEDPIRNNMQIDSMDPADLYKATLIMLAIDASVGLFCSIYIIFYGI